MIKKPTNEKMQEVYYSNLRVEMARFVPQECQRILDVGCSEGHFGELLKKNRKAEVWGVELSAEAGAVAATRLDKVITGDFTAILAQLPSNYFDCLVFNDVLEHFTHPDDILARCVSLLSPGGYIISSIPNVRYIGNLVEVLIHKDWEYKSGGILDRTHYRFFTRKSIIRMFSGAGFEVLLCTGINPTHSFKTWLLGLITLGHMADVKYLEFATVAKLI